MTASNDLLAQLADSAPRHLEELIQWLRIPSVSSDSSRVREVKQAATWVADKLECAGLSVEILPTEGHPMVYAESPRIDGAPVVLVYGHYDVQPVEPLDEWVNGPFDVLINHLLKLGHFSLLSATRAVEQHDQRRPSIA